MANTYTAYMPPNNGNGPFSYIAIVIAINIYQRIIKKHT